MYLLKMIYGGVVALSRPDFNRVCTSTLCMKNE